MYSEKKATIMKLGMTVVEQGICKCLEFQRLRDKAKNTMLSWVSLKV